MIRGINQMSKHIVVSGGTTSMPYINNYSGQSMVGQLRLNPSSQNIEVYDGSIWQVVGSSIASVGMSPMAEAAIDWAMNKQKEEQELDALCKKHPALAEAYERLQIIKALTKQSDSDTEKG